MRDRSFHLCSGGLQTVPRPATASGLTNVASKLPESEQKALAQWLLAELESERRWEEALVQSEDKLSGLGEEALAEYEARHDS